MFAHTACRPNQITQSTKASPIYELANAHDPKSRFLAGLCTEMSKSKMSIGTPCVGVSLCTTIRMMIVSGFTYESRASVRNIDDARDVTLHGSTAEQEIDLVVVVSCKSN